MKAYTPCEGTTITPEEKRRIASFHPILLGLSAETELIANIINLSRLQFLSLLDIVWNANHEEYIDSWCIDRPKRSVFGSVFHWLFGGLGGTDQNVEQLNSNVDTLMAKQNVQKEQIKEIFKLNNMPRVERTQNRRILKQLDVKVISLNHSVYSLQVEIGRLQIDRNFILSVLQIRSWLSNLLVGIIQLNKGLVEVYNCMTTLRSNILSPSIISSVDLRQLLIEVKQDLMGPPKLWLLSKYKGKGIWDYYRLLKIKSLILIQ